MTKEEQAEKRCSKYFQENCYKENRWADTHDLVTMYLDGYNKANEWHFVDREGLPEDKYKVFVQYVNGDYDIAFKFAGTWRGTSGNELRGVYAWKEIIPPKE